ncbi:XRE family transcriptional regulator [Brevibacillus laterosporus]|nr:helix-turn-helix transcriptional regulator [Brevibacillus laterosporus]TPG71150.1 XRE family transcriptional regulator [Brevibacillus laterosporus]
MKKSAVTINLKKMTIESKVKLYNEIGDDIYAKSQVKKERFIKAFTPEWVENGQNCKRYRESFGISLKELSELMGRSSSTLSKFEKGLPVMYADNITSAYYKLIPLINGGIKGDFGNEDYDIILHYLLSVTSRYTDILELIEEVENELWLQDAGKEIEHLFRYHVGEFFENKAKNALSKLNIEYNDSATL